MPPPLTILFSVLCLILLNHLTAGVGENCSWSLFGIWAEEWRYMADSDTPTPAIGSLFSGRHSLWLWLYTALHTVVAVALGWSLNAVLCVAFYFGRKAPSKITRGAPHEP